MDNNNDINTIRISTEQFTGLIRSRSKLETLRDAYKTMNMFDMEHVLDAVFYGEEKYKEGNDA